MSTRFDSVAADDSERDARAKPPLLTKGAEEANPLMAFVLGEHPHGLALLKMGLTGGGLLVLVALARARLFRIMRVGRVLEGLFVAYVVLITYEWRLLHAVL